MKNLAKILMIVIGMVIVSCNKSSGDSSGNGDGGKAPVNKAQGCVEESVIADNTTGGCRIRLVSPSMCEEIDLSAGKTYEIAWTTDGTTCETPWNAYVVGSPASNSNSYKIQINTNGSSVTSKGAVIQIDSSAFEGLQSTDGYYHWDIESFYGSHPASIKFRVKK